MSSNNSIQKLDTLISGYNISLSNLNSNFHSQASNLYLDIASNVSPIYSSLQSNENYLEKITNLLYVRNYYLTNNKQIEADMITDNMADSWQPLQTSKNNICAFMGVDSNIDTMALISQVTQLGRLIPGDLLGGLNNVVIYLNKLNTYQQLLGSNTVLMSNIVISSTWWCYLAQIWDVFQM